MVHSNSNSSPLATAAIAFPRTPAAYRPPGFADDTHIDDVLLGARQISAQHFRRKIVHHRGNAPHDVGGGIGAALPVRRNAQGHEDTQGPGTVRGEIRQRGPRRAKADLLEIEPVGAEMDVLERLVDADREGGRTHGNHRAVVTELRPIARDLSDPLDDAADAIELFAGTEIHGTFIFTTPLEPQVPLELEVWRAAHPSRPATHPEGPPGHRPGAGCGPSIAGRLARRPDRGHARRVPQPRRAPLPRAGKRR